MRVPQERAMQIICVTGSASGAGKTTVACGLLASLPGWSALKVTCRHGAGPCPHHGRQCNVCASLDAPWRLTEMTAGNDTPGKDTDRLRRAGARRVLWLVTHGRHLAQAMGQGLFELRGAPGVVVEGNSAATCLDADLVIWVGRGDFRRWSPSGRRAADDADYTILLRGDERPEEIQAVCQKALAVLEKPVRRTRLDTVGHDVGSA